MPATHPPMVKESIENESSAERVQAKTREHMNPESCITVRSLLRRGMCVNASAYTSQLADLSHRIGSMPSSHYTVGKDNSWLPSSRRVWTQTLIAAPCYGQCRADLGRWEYNVLSRFGLDWPGSRACCGYLVTPAINSRHRWRPSVTQPPVINKSFFR